MCTYLYCTANEGFVLPAYIKAQAIEYAKRHSPIKTLQFQGVCMGYENNFPSPFNGSIKVHLYGGEGEKVIKIDGNYFYKSEDVSGDKGTLTKYELAEYNNGIKYSEVYLFLSPDNSRGSLRTIINAFGKLISIYEFGQGGNSHNYYDNYFGNNINNNSGGNNSSSAHHCNSCSGTGVCGSCNGQGRYWIDTGTYTGYDSRKLTNCAVCGGSGKCRVCYGKGSFY